jgi:hypothetical protein
MEEDDLARLGRDGDAQPAVQVAAEDRDSAVEQ